MSPAFSLTAVSDKNSARTGNGQFRKGQSGNPNGRPRKTPTAKAQTRGDRARSYIEALSAPREDGWLTGSGSGWNNSTSGIGHGTHDKRWGACFNAHIVSSPEASELWRGNAIAARIIETWPNEMLRAGYDLRLGGSEPVETSREFSERTITELEKLNIDDALWKALAYERAYGGAAILLGVDDGKSPEHPLNEENIQSFTWANVFEPREVWPVRWYTDPRREKFGEPSHYDIIPFVNGPNATGQTPVKIIRVHESRIVAFNGVRPSRFLDSGEHMWGDSIMTRVYQALSDHGMGFSATAILLHDFAQTVYKIVGLSEAISDDYDEEIIARIAAIERMRSNARAIMIDSEEEFERKTTQLTGLPDLLDRFGTLLAAAADIPLTLLMGTSPGGLNATGDSDIRFFYDRVRAQQCRKLKPALERIIRLVLAAKKQAPSEWSVEFRPLWQPTDEEIAKSRYIQSQADQLAVQGGWLTAADVARGAFSGSRYSFERSTDVSELEQLEKETRELEREVMKAKATTSARPPANSDAPGKPPGSGKNPSGKDR